jgi:hypothetical protein
VYRYIKVPFFNYHTPKNFLGVQLKFSGEKEMLDWHADLVAGFRLIFYDFFELFLP